jgi:hypothetical protein
MLIFRESRVDNVKLENEAKRTIFSGGRKSTYYHAGSCPRPFLQLDHDGSFTGITMSSNGSNESSDRVVTRSAGNRLGSQEMVATVFFTHQFNKSIKCRYEKLKSDLAGTSRVYILAPLGTCIPDDHLADTYFFDYDQLRFGAEKVIGHELLPGNVHLVALDFFRKHESFDYYWFIEYDVVFTGNWATLFRAVENDPSDLLAAHVRNIAEEPAWPWWKTLDFPGDEVPQSRWLRAFFPVYRISKAGMRAVGKHVELGWSGHFEGLVPCAIEAESLSISDLGGNGSRVPRDRRDRFYSSFSSDSGRSLNAGTLRHRPVHYLPRLRKNTIYHPVKKAAPKDKLGIVGLLRQQHLRELPFRCAVSIYSGLASLRAGLRGK